ncbi:YbaB/EbfC family nucleoid-associated protein [Saccharopolyspora shandongensis]|uniref:YbaB/EbfC family nucleoid-associated protein n=1 Tax=Saccharopolyspora shandongensis TaxID=418495 RepID=UPI0034340DD9
MQPPEFGADPAQAEKALQNWAQGLQEKAQRTAAMQQEISRIRVTERGRSVSVTVDAEGVPTDVRFNDQRASGAELSAEFMVVLRRAQSRIADQVTAATKSTLGDRDAKIANAVAENYRQRFPTAPPAASPPPAPPGPPAPASPPAPARPPAQSSPTQAHGAHDDGDFSDESFLN